MAVVNAKFDGHAMDSEPNACDNGNTTTATVPDEVAGVPLEDVERNVLQEQVKRPLEESDNDTGKDQKKCKLDGEEPIISKTYLKKMEKRKKWLENKPIRAKIKKEKKKRKQKAKALMRESGIDIQKVKTRKMADSTCKQRIVLDMSYDNLMSFKDLCKCSTQLLRCYGVNRRMENPMQFYVTSYDGKFKEVMTRHNGYEYWDILYMTDSFDKIFKKEEIVYLTSDSSNVLNDLDDRKVYVIGGLVDHNSCKGASLKIAKDLGIAHARLPIDEFINMQSRKVLTIIHVFEILSKVVSGLSWKTAFSDSIPKRKMFTLKDENSVDDISCSLNGKQEENESPNEETQEKNKSADIEENKCPDVKENECSHVEENKYLDLEVHKSLDVEENKCGNVEEKNEHSTKEKNGNIID